MKSAVWSNQLLRHVFLNEPVALVGDGVGLPASKSPGNLYLSLHIADPGLAGDQSKHEVAFDGYARVAVPRTPAGWAVLQNLVQNAATISFPQCTGGEATVTHVGVGTSSSGPGKRLYRSALAVARAVNDGVTLELEAGALTVREE